MEFRLTNCIAIQVENKNKASQFYQSVMGMECINDEPGETELRCGDRTFFVEESPANKTFFDFEVDDIELAKNELLKAGCKITKEYSEKNFMVSDPFGMNFHLFEKGAQIVEGSCD